MSPVIIRIIRASVICRLAGVSLLLFLFLLGCAGTHPPPQAPPGYPRPYKAMGKWYQPVPDAKGYEERGIASWYGEPFHGEKTSNGEIYDMYGFTAAHKTLPFGTLVSVRNLENGQKINVRINDRGPFVHGRIIDLSYSAADKLGIIGRGTARVELVAVGIALSPKTGNTPGSYDAVDFSRGNFTFQVGAFRDRKNAQQQKQTLSRKYENVHIDKYDTGQGIYYRVRVGSVSTLDEAVKQESALIRDGFHDIFIVAE